MTVLQYVQYYRITCIVMTLLLYHEQYGVIDLLCELICDCLP